MRKLTGLAAVLLALSLLCLPAQAVGTNAASAILMDAESGRVLYQHDAHRPRLIASTTKLLTALVAVERAGDLDQVVTVKGEWLGSEGSSIYLKAGEQITLRSLLYGLLLQSGNDAAMAIACHTAGDVETFVALMNEKAVKLGMKDSSFANPSGLNDDNHYSTAYDMALLAQACLKNETVAEICATRSITVGTRTFVNHNKLLWSCPGCVGMKTGFTEKAGRTLVSAATREGMTLVCTTLSDGNDWNDHMALLDYGFANYRMETAVPAGRALASALVREGTAVSVPLAAADDLRYPLTGDERLTVVARAPVFLSAPVVPGQVVGEVCAYLEGEEVAKVDLVAAAPSAKKETPLDPIHWWDKAF